MTEEKQLVVRTRIAPSPTGYPHIGTIYQALFNYAFAKKNKGQFIIRIEDTDRTRFVEDAENVIFEAMDWFSLIEDESPRKGGSYAPYRQSERLDVYKKHALLLVDKGSAYYCFCTKQRLEEIRQKAVLEKKPPMYDKFCRKLSSDVINKNLQEKIPYVIRLEIPEHTTLVVKDGIRGDISFESNLLDDQVLLKSDGYPSYHLAVVVDDHIMNISHVLRGEEWISSLPKHWLLFDYFGWEKPLFYHTPLLRNPDKSKLSKRHGHTNVSWYQEQGYLPQAILNYLALMGWSHPQEKEIFSLSEFIDLFDFKDIKAVGPIFDMSKLQWINGYYIREKTDTELAALLYQRTPFWQQVFSKETFVYLVSIAKTRIKTLKEFDELITPFTSNEKLELQHEDKEKAGNLLQRLEEITTWDQEHILDVLKNFLKEHNERMTYIYKILLGTSYGLPLPDMFAVLGKDAIIKKLTINTS